MGRKRGPKPGIVMGTYRSTKHATSYTLFLRDDIRELVKAKANSEGRTVRNVVECALYYYVGGENLPIPHPDDPKFADTNSKRAKAAREQHLDTTNLDIDNREAMERGRRKEQSDREQRENPWNQ